MATSPQNKVSGEKLSATEINQIGENSNRGGGFKDTLNSGEAITGDTLPVAIFVSTNNKVYACDANDSSKLQFHGFAISTVAGADLAIEIQTSGVVSGFSGLTEGVDYYVQDDKTIGVSPGTNVIKVGQAISATEISIQREMQIRIGSASQSINDLTDQTITHNLGTIPKLIKITAVSGPTNSGNICVGSATSINNQSCVDLNTITGSGVVSKQDATVIIHMEDDSDVEFRDAQIKTITNTTFVLQWNTNSNIGGSILIQWEVIG